MHFIFKISFYSQKLIKIYVNGLIILRSFFEITMINLQLFSLGFENYHIFAIFLVKNL